MRILVVCSAFPPSRGGVENSVWELSTRFAARGHEVTVLTSTRGTQPAESSETVKTLRVVRFVERYHLLEAPLIPKLALAAFGYDYDVMHVHGMTPTVTDLAVIMAKLDRKPVVVTYHNDVHSDYGGRLGVYLRKGHERFSSLILGLADRVVCTTKSYGRTSPVLTHLKRGFDVIPVGVDPARYQQESPPRPQDPTKRLLFVGQLKSYKGVHILLDVIADLESEGYPVKLDVVGTGPILPDLRKKARDLGIQNSVVFHGNVPDSDLPKRYAGCDVVVLPSLNRREAFGMVQLEAAAAGKKVVASDMPGVSDVTRIVNGYLAKPGDKESLRKSILAALADSGAGASRAFPENMRWERIVDSYESIFSQLLREGQDGDAGAKNA